MAVTMRALLLVLMLSGCAGYELVGGRIVPIFDEPSYQTDIYTHVLFSDRNEVYTVAGECQIRAAKPVDHEAIGTSLWQCTQGVSTGTEFTPQEQAQANRYHVVMNYTEKPLVLEPEIGPCNLDVGLFEANNCTPFGSMSPIEYNGLVLITGDYVEIFAPRPVDENDRLKLNTLGHELCHAACPDSIDPNEPVPPNIALTQGRP